MYWLETTSNVFYNEVNRLVFKDFSTALEEYHRVVTDMMEELPKEQWFDLKLFRSRTPDDPVDTKGKSTKRIIVRSWTY